METFKILLCCGAGMSSGFLASNARKAVKKKNMNVTIEARSHSEATELMSTIDVLLFGPHYAKDVPRFSKLAEPYGVAVATIPHEIYGTLDGNGLIEFAKRIKIEKK